MSVVLVKKSDVLAAGFCGTGMKVWCRQHGITAAEINAGIPADRLMATECELAAQVVAAAVARQKTNEAQR